MKSFLTGVLLVLLGILIAGVIFLTASPPRGETIVLLPPPTPPSIVIHVEGAVTNPGVVRLPSGSRVQDAVEAAGGLLPEADQAQLNLAAPLADGTQIRVPVRSAVSNETHSPLPSSAIPINVNTATSDELATLPGIGPVTAQRIVDYRTQFGSFTTLEDLTQVFGIGPATLDQIKDLITITP